VSYAKATTYKRNLQRVGGKMGSVEAQPKELP